MTRQIGIIDLGSNSVRLTVVQLAGGGAHRVIDEAKATLRLAAAIDAAGNIGRAGLERTLQTLRDFTRLGRSHFVQDYLAVATAAVRQATNGPDFIRTASHATGIEFRVISEQEEAELGFLGALNTLDEQDGLVMDIGGASTELVRFAGRQVVAALSLPYGAVNLTDRFLPGNTVSSEQYRVLATFLSEVLGTVPWLPASQGLKLIGIGGTIRALARMDRKAQDYPLDVVHNYRMAPAALEALVRRIRSTPVDERAKIPGLAADRADVIAGGSAMALAVCQRTRAAELVISGAGIREGLLYRSLLPDRNPALVADVLAHAIDNLIHLYGLDEHRARRTARLALQLFYQLEGVHGMGPGAGRCLLAAASLRDLGALVNLYGQEQHAFYLISRGRLYGLTHREMLIAAAAAAYKSPGKSRSALAPYQSLLQPGDEEVAGRLGVLSAMARELTRFEPGAVHAVEARPGEGDVRIRLQAPFRPAAEARGLAVWEGDFRKLFGVGLQVDY